MQTTPSSSATMTSPGKTGTPAQPIGTCWSTAWCRARFVVGAAPAENTGRSRAAIAGGVAQRAVGDAARHAANGEPGHQDRSRGSRTAVTPAVHDQHRAGRGALDRVPLRVVVVEEYLQHVDVLASRDVAQREGLADHPAVRHVHRAQSRHEHVAQAAREQLGRDRRGADAPQDVENAVGQLGRLGRLGVAHRSLFPGAVRLISSAAGSESAQVRTRRARSVAASAPSAGAVTPRNLRPTSSAVSGCDGS